MNKDVYGVILAGGKGERLWPLSRQEFPKQLLSLSQKSLLEHTRDRLALFIDPSNILVVTTEQQAEAIVPFFNYDKDALLCEPFARNTAPAILLSCLKIAEKNPQALLLLFPADHYVTDNEKFVAAQRQAIKSSAQNDVITLIGIKPTYPATGYGYIEYMQAIDGAAQVVRFYEKPSLEDAQRYFQADTMLWNIGIFCAKASVFINEYKRLAPIMYSSVYDYFISRNKESYEKVESISVDYALMEKSDNLVVIPADFEWSDVGNLITFLSLQPKKDLQKPLEINATNNMVMADKVLTVLIGVHDLCIVQTNDVLLIAKRDDIEKVKLAVNELRKNNLDQYL